MLIGPFFSLAFSLGQTNASVSNSWSCSKLPKPSALHCCGLGPSKPRASCNCCPLICSCHGTCSNSSGPKAQCSQYKIRGISAGNANSCTLCNLCTKSQPSPFTLLEFLQCHCPYFKIHYSKMEHVFNQQLIWSGHFTSYGRSDPSLCRRWPASGDWTPSGHRWQPGHSWRQGQNALGPTQHLRSDGLKCLEPALWLRCPWDSCWDWRQVYITRIMCQQKMVSNMCDIFSLVLDFTSWTTVI